METFRPPPDFAQTRLFWIAWVIKWNPLLDLTLELCSRAADLSIDLTFNGVLTVLPACPLLIHPLWIFCHDLLDCFSYPSIQRLQSYIFSFRILPCYGPLAQTPFASQSLCIFFGVIGYYDCFWLSRLPFLGDWVPYSVRLMTSPRKFYDHNSMFFPRNPTSHIEALSLNPCPKP